MKVLLTGANGYIGQRLLPYLLDKGYEVCILVRSIRRVEIPDKYKDRVEVVIGDLSNLATFESKPDGIDVAFYLIHSLSIMDGNHSDLEKEQAENFLKLLEPSRVQNIIYLNGICEDEANSPYSQSRNSVINTLRSSKIPTTVIHASVIIGSGSITYEVIRDIVSSTRFMLAPKWIKNFCRPVAIQDILDCLLDAMNETSRGADIEIGGRSLLTIKQMLIEYARIAGHKISIVALPFNLKWLSKLFIHFKTSLTSNLARVFVDRLIQIKQPKIEPFKEKGLRTYEQMLSITSDKIGKELIYSSWKDAISVSQLNPDLLTYAHVPIDGVYKDEREFIFQCDPDEVKKTVWSIGGTKGWFYMNWAWSLRGILDQLIMGIGLKRGRRHPTSLRPGDALDFWRVLVADEENRRLLLYAEMWVPGQAWLEFQINPDIHGGGVLIQRAVFKPYKYVGSLYWYLMGPFHYFLFDGMGKGIIHQALKQSIEKR